MREKNLTIFGNREIHANKFYIDRQHCNNAESFKKAFIESSVSQQIGHQNLETIL